jgi:mono/diheme cytochrome c family protein
MRRIARLNLAASVAMLATLAACGGGGETAPTAAAAPTAATTTTAGTPSSSTTTTPTPSSTTTTATTGDALAGKALWNTKVTGVGLACVDCHNAPADNVNNVLNGAAGWEVIARTIRDNPSMQPFSGKLSGAQMVDLSAYLRNPTL